MDESVNTYVTQLPPRIKAFTVRKNDCYTIFINDNLSWETKQKAYKHEIEHIKNGDFDKSCSVNEIECEAHKGNKGGTL